MFYIARLTSEQIIQRIANANSEDPTLMREKIQQALDYIIADTSRPHSSMLKAMFQGRTPTVDELVVALEHELYDAMMPRFPGWEWDGEGYKNIRIYGSD